MKKSAHEATVSRWFSVAVVVLTLTAAVFVAHIGSVVLDVTGDVDAKIERWSGQIEQWEHARRREAEQRAREMEATRSLAAALEQSIEAQSIEERQERLEALERARKHAVASQAKSASAEVARARNLGHDRDLRRAKKKLRAVMDKAEQLGVELDEF